MRTIGDVLFVTIDTEHDNVVELGNGNNIIISREGFGTNAEMTRKYGKVMCENQMGIKPGTIVFFHHFVVCEANDLDTYVSHKQSLEGDDYYVLNWKEDVYGYLNEGGDFVTVNDWVFVELGKEEDKVGKIYMPFQGQEDVTSGTVVYINPETQALIGVFPGDTVQFYDAPYKIEINGRELTRIAAADMVYRA